MLFQNFQKKKNQHIYAYLIPLVIYDVLSVTFSLDTFPYAGTTTTCESLYMGVPCVTMAGSVHAHNVGVSLLSNVGKKIFYSLFDVYMVVIFCIISH